MTQSAFPQPLVKLLGIESLSDEKKVEVIKSVTEVVEKRVLAAVLEALPADMHGHIADKLEANEPIDMGDLAKQHNIDLDALTQQALKETAAEIIAAKNTL